MDRLKASELCRRMYLGSVEAEGLVMNPHSIVLQGAIDRELTNTFLDSSLDDFPRPSHVSDLQARSPFSQKNADSLITHSCVVAMTLCREVMLLKSNIQKCLIKAIMR